jgi:tetratricopeptide (TPR) repeat protein
MPLPTPKPSTTRSPADQLRDWLTDAERSIIAMGTNAESALAVIRLNDQISERLLELKAGRIDLRSEETRIESLRKRLMREARQVVGQVRASGQAAQLADSPTWKLMQETADAEQRTRTRKFITIGAIIGLLALLLFVVLPWIFPPTPTANTGAIMQLLDEGKPDEALARALAEQQRAPKDADIWIWLGVLYQQRGQQADADAAWQTAHTLVTDLDFYNTRGIVFLQMKNYAAAEADARQLLNDSQAAPNGYYLLGQIQVGQDKPAEALASFQQAATLAEESNNATIVIASKLEIQNLMQRAPAIPATPKP